MVANTPQKIPADVSWMERHIEHPIIEEKFLQLHDVEIDKNVNPLCSKGNTKVREMIHKES